MHNYGREVPNFSEDTGLLASSESLSGTMIDSYMLGAEILETQDKYQEFGRQVADAYWEQAVIPRFTELGYEDSSFGGLTKQAKANLWEWREVFDEFNQRFPTLESGDESDLTCGINLLPKSERRLRHFQQVSSLLYLLEQSKNGEVPEDKKELVDDVIDCARRLILESQVEISDISTDISKDGRNLLVTNDEVIEWVKDYISGLD